MAFSDPLVALSQRFQKVAPLPWAELNARGQGLVASNEYLNLLTTRWAQFLTVVGRYNLQLDNDALTSGIAALGEALNEHARVFLEADLRGMAEVARKDAFMVPGPLLRALLAAAYTQSDLSYFTHLSGTWRDGVTAGALDLATAQEDASRLYQIMGAILFLEDAGLLSAAGEQVPVPPPPPVQGLGAPPVPVLVAGVVVLVVLMGALCFIFLQVYAAQERMAILQKCCHDKEGNPREAPSAWCKTFCEGMAKRADPAHDPFAVFLKETAKGIGSGLKWALAIGGSILALQLAMRMTETKKRKRKKKRAAP